MEPHQEPSSTTPQHIPSPARHHTYHYLGHTSSSPSLCDKRLIRRSTHGTPYPQTIAIPPPPAYLSSSPILSIRTPNGAPTTPARTPSATPVTPSLPLASPFSPPPIARTTSSLARRRRSTVSSNSPPSNPNSSPEMSSRPPPMAPPPAPNSSSTLQQMLQSQQFQRPPSSAATTPGHSSTGQPNFWGPNYGTASSGASSLFEKDETGLGGTWRGRETWNRTSISSPTDAANRAISPEDDGDLALQLEEAMDEDSTSDEDEPPKFVPPAPRKHNANGNQNKRREADDDLARIAQAMTLLSLQPGAGPSEIINLGPHFPNGSTGAEQEGWPPHPTPESLLRESLRQTFEAYRTMKLLDRATVPGGAGARQNSVSSGASSRRQSVHTSDQDERELSVVAVLKAYEQAEDGIRAAREVMGWAEHWIREERERARERLLKG